MLDPEELETQHTNLPEGIEGGKSLNKCGIYVTAILDLSLASIQEVELSNSPEAKVRACRCISRDH